MPVLLWVDYPVLTGKNQTNLKRNFYYEKVYRYTIGPGSDFIR